LPIPEATIQAIRDQTDIAEIVGQYVDLRRAGSNLKGLCPFHSEKTPSFNVSPERQTFHCFGCGKGGNVFTFLMEMEGVSFPEAVRALGERCGVEVAYQQVEREERSRNDALFAANTFAARHYHLALVDDRSAAGARAYLEERGIPREAWVRFGLGHAGEAWDGLWTAARRARIPEEDLAELKLIVRSEKTGGYRDYFRSRVIFPIVKPGARVTGFGARALGAGVEPKYLNSAESPIFAKRRTLYGLDRAREAIRHKHSAVLVEGYTDLISLHLAGVEHALATCGTALSIDHATILRRLTSRAILVPDGDPAGELAAVTSGAILLAAGVDAAVARLSAGDDPDSTARRLGREGTLQLIDSAVSYTDYLGWIVKTRGESPREKEAIVRRVLDALVDLDDPVRLDLVTGDLARVLAVNPESLRAAVRRPRARRAGAASAGKAPVAGEAPREALERLGLRLIMEGTPFARESLEMLDEGDFSAEDARNVYKLLDSAAERRIDLRGRDFQRQAEEAGLEGLAAEIALIQVPPGNVDTLLKDIVRRIKELRIRDELSALRRRLHDLPSESEEAVAVAEYYHRLKQALVEL
jgi:DNA primase